MPSFTHKDHFRFSPPLRSQDEGILQNLLMLEWHTFLKNNFPRANQFGCISVFNLEAGFTWVNWSIEDVDVFNKKWISGWQRWRTYYVSPPPADKAQPKHTKSNKQPRVLISITIPCGPKKPDKSIFGEDGMSNRHRISFIWKVCHRDAFTQKIIKFE